MSELIALNNSAQFSFGTFENTTITGESVTLCQTAGCFIQAGSYTTQVFGVASFTSLCATACCDIPCKTAVELLVRVMINGEWSRWLSFGKYSHLIKRRAVVDTCDVASLSNGVLTLNGKCVAEAFQLKIYLYSDSPNTAPILNMISASVRPLFPQTQITEVTVRELPVPAYSQMVRSPVLRGKIALPTAVAMLLNRHGEDVLPEQTAHAMLCYESKEYTNIHFAVSLCGIFGYDCAAVFCDTAYIKKEIRQGRAVIAVLMDGNAIVIRGFLINASDEDIVIANNPNAATNEESEQQIPLSELESQLSGLCILLHGKRRGSGTSAPQCRPATIKKNESDEYVFCVATLPVNLLNEMCAGEDVCEGTICASAKNTTAFASAAQKNFEYLTISQAGNIIIPPDLFSKGTKITVYIIDHTGSAYAAETSI